MLADLEQVLCAAGNSMALLAEALDPESTESMYALLALQTTRRGEALVKEIGSRLKNPSERNYERPKLKPQKLKKQTT